jgi:hypothetical protein
MEHPLRTWLKAQGKSVMAFCEGQPFSYPTVYKLLKGEGTFQSDTLIDVARATNDEVPVSVLIEALRDRRTETITAEPAQ